MDPSQPAVSTSPTSPQSRQSSISVRGRSLPTPPAPSLGMERLTISEGDVPPPDYNPPVPENPPSQSEQVSNSVPPVPEPATTRQSESRSSLQQWTTPLVSSQELPSREFVALIDALFDHLDEIGEDGSPPTGYMEVGKYAGYYNAYGGATAGMSISPQDLRQLWERARIEYRIGYDRDGKPVSRLARDEFHRFCAWQMQTSPKSCVAVWNRTIKIFNLARPDGVRFDRIGDEWVPQSLPGLLETLPSGDQARSQTPSSLSKPSLYPDDVHRAPSVPNKDPSLPSGGQSYGSGASYQQMPQQTPQSNVGALYNRSVSENYSGYRSDSPAGYGTSAGRPANPFGEPRNIPSTPTPLGVDGVGQTFKKLNLWGSAKVKKVMGTQPANRNAAPYGYQMPPNSSVPGYTQNSNPYQAPYQGSGGFNPNAQVPPPGAQPPPQLTGFYPGRPEIMESTPPSIPSSVGPQSANDPVDYRSASTVSGGTPGAPYGQGYPPNMQGQPRPDSISPPPGQAYGGQPLSTPPQGPNPSFSGSGGPSLPQQTQGYPNAAGGAPSNMYPSGQQGWQGAPPNASGGAPSNTYPSGQQGWQGAPYQSQQPSATGQPPFDNLSIPQQLQYSGQHPGYNPQQYQQQQPYVPEQQTQPQPSYHNSYPPGSSQAYTNPQSYGSQVSPPPGPPTNAGQYPPNPAQYYHNGMQAPSHDAQMGASHPQSQSTHESNALGMLRATTNVLNAFAGLERSVARVEDGI